MKETMERNDTQNAPWTLLEHIDEMVYVTDMDTDMLLYANRHLRNTLGLEGHAGYLGKKCYQVLQGFEGRCSFCTNDKLSCDCFYSWTYKNPIMNKRFLLKDTMLLWKGRRCRMEIAIDIDSDLTKNVTMYSARAESILSECLKRLAQVPVANDAMQNLLGYIGETLLCDRTYIFELSEDLSIMDNTYEWCAHGVIPQKDILQNESTTSIDWWLKSFQKDQLVRIDNLEDLRQTEPLTYAILKPQDIHSLLVGPIYNEKQQLIGFVGADNPDPNMIALIAPLLKTISYFIATLFQRRDLLSRLEMLSYRDSLTNCLNRNALSEYYSAPMAYLSVGLLYCDVSGLKQVNDTIGHEAGDELILKSCRRIESSVPEAILYRIGGDEFLGICPNIDEELFRKRLEQLRQDIAAETFHVAVGGVWSNHQPIQLESLMTLADQDMYADKKLYYQQNAHLDRRNRGADSKRIEHAQQNTTLQEFLKENNCDAETVFRSVELSRKKEYIFIGNMRTHQYYISDAMRDTFGFPSNQVSELATQWVSRIATADDVKVYQQSMARLMAEKWESQELRYRVRDVNGQIFWIESHIAFRWDAGGQMEFMSGIFIKQDALYLKDYTTGFHSAYEAALALDALQEPTELLVFGLNHYDSINEQLGRHGVNHMLREIAMRLQQNFGNLFHFYRLEGVHFLALPYKKGEYSLMEMIHTIGDFIQQFYLESEIYARNPVVFGIMQYPNGVDTPDSLIEEASSLTLVAKKNQNRKYLVYSPTSPTKLKDINELEKQFQKAVRQGMQGFSAAFRPILKHDTSAVMGGQICLQWRYGGKQYEEGEIFSFLENPDVVVPISTWMLEESIRCCRRILSHTDEFTVVMCGAGAVKDPKEFFYMADMFLKKYHISGEHLVIELCQSDFREDPQQMHWFAGECDRLGIRIALVKFSPEFAAWGFLANHPSRILSPHKSILNQQDNAGTALALLKSLAHLSHSTDKLLWLEGIHTEQNHRIANEVQADLVEGTYYHELMDCEQMIKYINDSNAVALP